jgi:3-phenylpropionate/trans-cinnamate dioxygenase ferredoxin component
MLAKKEAIAVTVERLDNSWVQSTRSSSRSEDYCMAFTRVATLGEIGPGTSRQVILNGRKLALFNVEGAIYAIDDTCPHRGASLSEGECEGTEVMCLWHGARFDLKTGSHLGPPAQTGVLSFKVQIIGNEVLVETP